MFLNVGTGYILAFVIYYSDFYVNGFLKYISFLLSKWTIFYIIRITAPFFMLKYLHEHVST